MMTVQNIRDAVLIRNGIVGGVKYYEIIDSIISEVVAMAMIDLGVAIQEEIPEVIWMVIQKIVVGSFGQVGKESLSAVSGIVSETYKDMYKENRGSILQYVQNIKDADIKRKKYLQWGNTFEDI